MMTSPPPLSHRAARRLAMMSALTWAALSGPALAQGRPDIPAAYAGADAVVVVGCDLDRNLVTSREEMTVCVGELFAVGDEDRSGTISYLELESFRAKVIGTDRLPPYRLEFDRDQSMAITPAEFAAAWMARFDGLDPQRTGRVDRTQLYRAMPRPDMSGMRRPPGGAPSGGPPPGGSGRPPF